MGERKQKSYTLENAPEESIKQLIEGLSDLIDLIKEVAPEYYESTVVSNAVDAVEKAKG